MVATSYVANIFLVALSAAQSASAQSWSDEGLHETILPSDFPVNSTADPWQCVVANLTQYFDPPMPTGALYTAMIDYAEDLRSACPLTGIAGVHRCRPSKDQWCGVTSAVEGAAMTADLSSWGSSASSWWSSRREDVISLAEECPRGWYNAMYGTGAGFAWLNITVMYAACHDEAYGTTESSEISQTATPVALPASGMRFARAAITPTPSL